MATQQLYKHDWLSLAVDSASDAIFYHINPLHIPKPLDDAVKLAKSESTAGPQAWPLAIEKACNMYHAQNRYTLPMRFGGGDSKFVIIDSHTNKQLPVLRDTDIDTAYMYAHYINMLWLRQQKQYINFEEYKTYDFSS